MKKKLSLLLMAGILKTGTWTATLYARENEMKENMKIRGQLRTYLQWPIILSVFLLAANLAVGIVSPAAGLVMSGFTVIYVLVALWLFMYRRKRLMGGLVEFSAEYAWVQKQLLYEMAVPYAIADTEGHFLWLNHSFSEIVGEDKNCRKNIAAVFPELTREFLDEMDEKTSVHSSFDGRFYRIDIQQVALSETEGMKLGAVDEDSGEMLEHGEFLVDAWQPEGHPKYTRQWLQQEFAAGRKRELCLFWGHQPSEDGQLTKSCLSQWWMEDFYTMADAYLCMEQYMMAAKAELFGDKEIRDQILKCSDQKQIKALGRKVRGFEQKVWDKFKYAIVLLGNWHKFSQNRELREFLLSTGDSVLVEASPYDAIWGIRLAASSPEAQDPMKWRGQNLLGFALMEVRDELRRVTQNEMLCDWNAV